MRELRSVDIDGPPVPSVVPAISLPTGWDASAPAASPTPASQPYHAVIPTPQRSSPLPDRGVLDKLEQLIRDVYVICYREFSNEPHFAGDYVAAWDGGEDNYGRNHTCKWPAVARTILQLEANPMLYIKSQFALATTSRAPQPNQLCSPHAISTWRQYESQIAGQIERQLTVDRHTLQAAAEPMMVALGWASERAIRYCLNSTVMANLSPLFRYCLGSEMGLQEVMARFWERALLQYVFQKSIYDHSWGSFVPLELQRAADSLRRDLIGGS